MLAAFTEYLSPDYLKAYGALIGAVAGPISVFLTAKVLREVKTGNAQTMGALADKAETRRIEELPKGERTEIDEDHMKAMENKAK